MNALGRCAECGHGVKDSLLWTLNIVTMIGVMFPGTVTDKDFSGLDSEYTLVKSGITVISCIMSLWLERRHLRQRF